MQSFPSGHTATASTVGVYLALYLNAKLKAFSDYQTSYWKMIVVLLPLIGAGCVAGLLVIDGVSGQGEITCFGSGEADSFRPFSEPPPSRRHPIYAHRWLCGLLVLSSPVPLGVFIPHQPFPAPIPFVHRQITREHSGAAVGGTKSFSREMAGPSKCRTTALMVQGGGKKRSICKAIGDQWPGMGG